MKYKVIILPNFEMDVDHIVRFYYEKNTNYIPKFLKNIKSSINSLKEFPERFSKIPELSQNNNLNIRQYVFDNYRIIYQIKDNIVYVLTILGENLLNIDKLNI